MYGVRYCKLKKYKKSSSQLKRVAKMIRRLSYKCNFTMIAMIHLKRTMSTMVGEIGLVLRAMQISVVTAVWIIEVFFLNLQKYSKKLYYSVNGINLPLC